MMTARWREDRGVATVLGIALAFVVMASGLVILAIVALTVGHQRAAVAADLAALAAAAHGCDVAEQVARAQGAISVACSLQGVTPSSPWRCLPRRCWGASHSGPGAKPP